MQSYPMNYQNYNYQPMLQCRIVDDFNQITAMDVPMDGKPAVFIKRDMSELQTRSWGSDGRIYPMVFRPFREEPIAEPPQNDVSERLRAIEEKIDKLSRPSRKGQKDANNEPSDE